MIYVMLQPIIVMYVTCTELQLLCILSHTIYRYDAVTDYHICRTLDQSSIQPESWRRLCGPLCAWSQLRAASPTKWLGKHYRLLHLISFHRISTITIPGRRRHDFYR